MQVELLTKPDSQPSESLPIVPHTQESIAPCASTCTWCGKSMFWDNHCRTREEAANCSNYGSRRG
ncbi:MAG: hypothetical protein DCF22_22190 [Leptolyngbya sp.]|nr:MAG: hypothetical protein DCF22_22190 [Leptolyngbya sp.]